MWSWWRVTVSLVSAQQLRSTEQSTTQDKTQDIIHSIRLNVAIRVYDLRFCFLKHISAKGRHFACISIKECDNKTFRRRNCLVFIIFKSKCMFVLSIIVVIIINITISHQASASGHQTFIRILYDLITFE